VFYSFSIVNYCKYLSINNQIRFFKNQVLFKTLGFYHNQILFKYLHRYLIWEVNQNEETFGDTAYGFFHGFFCSLPTWANDLTGYIQSLHANLNSKLFHIQLTGTPNFDGGSCKSVWTGNSLSDVNFRDFVMPLLIEAKAKGEKIRVWVSGCNKTYPKIYAVDWSPREK